MDTWSHTRRGCAGTVTVQLIPAAGAGTRYHRPYAALDAVNLA